MLCSLLVYIDGIFLSVNKKALTLHICRKVKTNPFHLNQGPKHANITANTISFSDVENFVPFDFPLGPGKQASYENTFVQSSVHH